MPMQCGVMARTVVAAFVLCCASVIDARAADDLYRAQTVVTGTEEPNRLEGFGGCLEEVLVKVSAVQKLASDPRLAAYKAKAKDAVSAYSYHDQMSGIPIHDEQGTRDRPYDLFVDFDPNKIADILKGLGLKPWLSHRPVVAVFAGFQQGGAGFVVAADGDRGDLQRESVQATASKIGMPIVLPSTDALKKSGIDAKLRKATLANLASLGPGGELILVGQLAWNERKLDWSAQWRMEWDGKPHQWQVRAGTYDEAFRRGLGGVAQILSGNGEPK